MAIIVERTDTFEQWRLKTNLISLTADATSNIGNLQQLVTVTKSNIVAAINETQTSSNITGGRATFTGNVVINYNGSNSALRITQTGTGNALLVEDAANPDSTPFIVDNTGNVGIGGIPSASKFFIFDSEKGMTIYGAGGATVPYAMYASGGVNAVLGQVIDANSAIRGYNSTTNSNGFLGRQYYGIHGVGPLQSVGPGESIGVLGSVTGSANVGVFGYNETTLSYGYLGISGFGVQGYGGSQNVGAGGSIGVYGQASGTSNIGVFGRNGAGYGYIGYGTNGIYGGITGAANVAIVGANETTGAYSYLGGPDNFGLYTVGNAYISGDVGVGTTNPTAKLDIVGRMRVGSDASGADTGTGTVIWNTAGGDAGFAGYQQIFYTGANNSRTERMRINEVGNVSITGNLSTNNLSVFGSISTSNIRIGADTSSLNSNFAVKNGNVLFTTNDIGQTAFVRIDHTTNSNAIGVTHLSLRFTDLEQANANTTSAFLACTDSANIGGSQVRLVIRPTGSVRNYTGSYEAISDQRLKENIVDTTPKLDDVMKLRVRNYNFINDPNFKQLGFVAQEMANVFPGLVDDDGETLSVKTSILIPILVKALQELTIQVDDLKYELDSLKANI